RLEPARDRVGLWAGEQRHGQALDELDELHDVSAGARIFERELRVSVLAAPGGGPPPELGDDLGLAARQLVPEHAAKGGMDAIPEPLAIEPGDEQVGALDPVELLARARRADDGIAERPTEPFQLGGARE